jgi:RHS repeat-associated protein
VQRRPNFTGWQSGVCSHRIDNTDPNGCGSFLLDQTRTHNAVNEITGITEGAGQPHWPSPAYDAAGNMTSGPKGDSPTTKIHMKWDAWNRLTECRADSSQSPGSPGALIASYSYDGRNYRIRKSVAGDANYDYYYNEGWQVIEERKNDSANPYVQYVWDLRYIDSPVCRFRDSACDGTMEETLYYLNDVNFNVTALVDGTAGGGTFGNVVERYVYDPYGKPTVYNSDWSSTVSWENSKKNEIRFCGYRYDWERGDCHVRMRPYSPSIGRWRAPEHWNPYTDGMSRLLYGLCNPLQYTDPMGLRGSQAASPTAKEVFNHLWNWFVNTEKRLPITSLTTGFRSLRFKLGAALLTDMYSHEIIDGTTPFFNWDEKKYKWPKNADEIQIFHEAIHGYDAMNGWYANGTNPDNAERLACTAEFLDRVLESAIARIEKDLFPIPDEYHKQEITRVWNRAWNAILWDYNHNGLVVLSLGWWDKVRGNPPRTEKLQDWVLWDVAAKLGLRVSCSEIRDDLMRAYHYPADCFACPSELPSALK